MGIASGKVTLGTKATGINLVTFRLEQQIYALPIEPIQQIIEMVTVTPVPQVKDMIEGVINFHGTPVPVVSLRRQLDMPRAQLQLHTHIILVTISRRLVGLIVDEVLDVLNLLEGQIIPPQQVMPEQIGAAPTLRGLIQLGEKTILCLDIDHIFDGLETQDLDKALAAAADLYPKTPAGEA